MQPRLNPYLGLLVLLAVTATATNAAATDKAECVRASEAGQERRLDGRLTEARARFGECRDVSCPKMVRDACAEWFEETDRTIPTVIVAIHEPGGEDVVGGALFVDDAPHAIDGREIPLDPGPHRVRAVTGDGREKTESFVARIGERSRALTIVVPPRAVRHVVPWPGIVTAVGAGVAWATFAGLGVAGVAEYDARKTECAPRCMPGAYGSANALFIGADIALGVAAVTTVLAVVLFVTHRYTTITAAAPFVLTF